MSYSDTVVDLSLIQKYGWSGVRANHGRVEPLPWVDWILSFFKKPSSDGALQSLVQRYVQEINQAHLTFSPASPATDLHTFFHSKQLFQKWNQSNPSMQIAYRGSLQATSPYLPEDLFDCSYETEQLTPLIVSPKDPALDLPTWARGNQDQIARVMRQHGALVFHGFSLSQERFAEAFEAVTGKKPAPYTGDAPRQAFGGNIYRSTSVADDHPIPLHQETAAKPERLRPGHIAFFCETPPLPGTGQTLLGSARAVTEAIQRDAPDIWRIISEKKLTYTARYLPDSTYHTAWMQRLNPSHATVGQYFQTQDRSAIAELCAQEGSTCTWDNGWAVVSRSGIPATVLVDNVEVFCNQIHTNKLNPELCGYSTLNYWLARLFVYQTSECMQYDVKCDDGTPIGSDVGGRILRILKEHEIVRDWKPCDLMVVDNERMMHGKMPHQGARSIRVAMA